MYKDVPVTGKGIGGEVTHAAYADEKGYNTGRYRGVGLVTLKQEDASRLTAELWQVLQKSGIVEFKWKELDDAKYRFAALKMLDWAIGLAVKRIIRIDVLVWDIRDSRHDVQGRDDIANLQRMYYRLLTDVLCKRWPDGSTWQFCPDENTAIKWNEVEDFLDMAGSKIEERQDLFAHGGFSMRLKQEFSIGEITPVRSHQEPLVQLADLLVGLAVYSRNSYHCYDQWLRTSGPQLSLLAAEPEASQLSRSDYERCQVLTEFDTTCKGHKLGVSLRTFRGLKTPNPLNPINFWWYEPQCDEDKAPIKSAREIV